jgi:hypothetical protein
MDLFAQREAVDKLHRDEVHTVRFAYLVDMCNVWVIEGSRSFRFLNKALHAILVCGNFGGQDFQRDFAIESRVKRQIYFTHAACAKLRADCVTTELCPCSNIHS